MKELEYNEPYSNNLHFLFIELPRFNKVFQNLSHMNEIPAEFDENYFADLFDIANFAPGDRQKYLEDQKMIYDYQNCIDFAREQGLMDGLAKGEESSKYGTFC